MSKNYYVVGRLETEKMTNAGIPMKLSWWDGQVGVLPVFTNKRKAEKVAGKKYPVIKTWAKL